MSTAWRGSRRRRHLCLPPTGVVFESTWQCPECGNRWRIVEHANNTEWVLTAVADGLVRDDQ